MKNKSLQKSKPLFVFLLTLVVIISLASCQSDKTERMLYGKWAYSGSSVCYLMFGKDHKCGIVQMRGISVVDEIAHYEVNGRNVTVRYDDGRTRTLRLSENGKLYAGDSSEYVKTEDF